jgi:hypothetical protein
MSSHARALWPAQAAQAGAIASALGSGWRLGNDSRDPDQYQCLRLIRAVDSLTLALDWPEPYGAAKGKPARVTISLVWPCNAKGDRRIVRAAYNQPEPTTSISVDGSKPAATIAKDISRRLIPTAERLHAEAIQLIAQSDTAAAAQRATVAAILQAEPGSHLSQNSGEHTIYLGARSHGYTLRVDSDTSVRFEPFSVDLLTALKVLQLLRKAPSFAEFTTCEACGASISEAQASLSRARADDADPTCADCLTLAATAAALAEGHDYINAADVARMEAEQAERRAARVEA